MDLALLFRGDATDAVMPVLLADDPVFARLVAVLLDRAGVPLRERVARGDFTACSIGGLVS